MVRVLKEFYIVKSSTGALIMAIKENRTKFSDGPYIKVCEEVFCVSLEQSELLGGPIFIPEEVRPADYTQLGGSRSICVKKVIVSSWSEKTTDALLRFFFNASKLTTHTTTVDVEALVGPHNVGQITAMVIGAGGNYLKSIVKKDAKVFTRRAINPNVFVVEAYSVKKLLGVKIRLEKAIREVHADILARRLEDNTQRHASKPTRFQPGERSFAHLAYDDEDEDEDEAEEAEEPSHKSRRLEQLVGGDRITDTAWPVIAGSEPPPAPKKPVGTTIAEKLEDAKVRGETFDHKVPHSETDPEDSTESEYGDMPPLAKGISVEDFFSKNSATVEWS